MNVLGSLADKGSARIRFAPESGLCGATRHVRFGPIADIRQWPDFPETLPRRGCESQPRP